METYWQQAARGAKPAAGTTFLTNPTANTGMTPGGFDWNNVLVSGQGVGAGSQGGPAWDENNRKVMGDIAMRKQKNLQDTLFKQAGDAQAAQQAAVKSRLDEQIMGYKERRKTAATAMAGAGKSATDEINRHFDQLVGRTQMQMKNSGLGQTTAMPTTISGIERDRAAALRDAGVKTAMDTTNVDLQTSGDYLDFLGGIEDEFDMDPLLQLANQRGEATQNQLDNSAFGGNFFGGMGGGPRIGGSAYGGFAGGGYGGGDGGYGQPVEAGNWITPEEQAMLQGQQRQQPKSRRLTPEQLQNKAQIRRMAQLRNAFMLQEQARYRIVNRPISGVAEGMDMNSGVAEGMDMNSGYGPDSLLWGARG